MPGRPVTRSRRARLCGAVLLLALAAARAVAAVPGAALEDDAALVGAALTLVDERLALMPAVAAAKWPRHLPVADPAREAEVVAAAGERASALGLARAPVEALMRLQIRRAREVQDALFAGWAVTPPAPGVAPRSLADDLRPALDRLTPALLRALYLAAPSLARPDLAADAAALADARLPATRWSGTERTELVAALGAVRFATPAGVDRARAAGLLRIGTPGDYAPFAHVVDGRVTGSDVELALALAAATGLEPVFVRSSWQRLLEDLGADRFDVAVGGISVTAARAAVAEFSAPVARSGKSALGRCADRARFASPAAIDRPGTTVIENPGGTNEAIARRLAPHARLVINPDNLTVFDAILAGRADVMYTDETEIALAVHRHATLCRLLAAAYEPADKAFLFSRGSGWAALVDPWLREATARGVPQRLLGEYLNR